MKRVNILLISIIAILASCAPSVQVRISKAYPALKTQEAVRVIEVQEQVPGNAEPIGQVAIANTSGSNCSYQAVLDLAKEQARKVGGNAVKIVQHQLPGDRGRCHRIAASILRIDATKDSTIVQAPESKPAGSAVSTPSVDKSDEAAKKLFMQPVPLDWHWRLAVNGCWSWRTAKIESNLNEFERSYIKELKKGSSFGGDIEYYFGDNYGAGFKYNRFHSSASAMASAQVSPGVYVNGELYDDISIVFIGPKFCIRVPSQTMMNAFVMGLSIGYEGYTDDGGFGATKGKIEGSTAGIVYEMGYDFGISNHFALGINTSITLGSLSQYTVSSNGVSQVVKLGKDQYEGIGFFDIGLGLRIR